MERGKLSNDNRRLDHGIADPDRDFVGDLMAELCRHLKDRGVDRHAVATAMLDELFKMVDGNPFRTGEDEGLIRADQQFLWRLKHRVVPMSEQWDKAWLRLRGERRPTFQFNRAAPLPVKGPGPRRKAPPPDYDANRHAADLSILKMRPGHFYTENEVMVRYRRKMLRALGNRHVQGYDRVKGLVAAKRRILGWLRRSHGQVIYLDQA